ncbi:GAF domain-containing protein [Halomicrobium zhouii]|uniref:GAF domain-containing protein n=1 Tax=Halomicrobium zhouii TaxID=767519 RepID=A0A1I6M7X5_9EURY|nr:GAF domain-containing protein [Halomicrobium zhouii]SFS11612.1 GAF domain-containing protein [Halomicrobium zhouii]
MSETTVLCVGADESDGLPPVDRLASDGDVRVLRRETVAAAAATLADRSVDCLVTEYDLPDGTGTELIGHVREVDPDTGCILCGDASQDLTDAATGTETNHVAEFVRTDSPGATTRVAQLVEATARHRSQTAYPLPQDEDDRLAAMERYDFDSERFRSGIRRLADVAAAHFDVAQSSVNLVTERTQEFLACHGEEWDATAREQSICAYAILEDGVTVVEDTLEDPRFEGNEVLDELGVRFYAGASVTTDDGLPLGTVCVYDDEPRAFTEDDEAFLELLAAAAADWLAVLRDVEGGPVERRDHWAGAGGERGDR